MIKEKSLIVRHVYAGLSICNQLTNGNQDDFNLFRLDIKSGWILFDGWVFSTLLCYCRAVKVAKT